VNEFAARENLSAQRLYRWRAELGSGRVTKPAFIEIRPPAPAAIEVALRSGHILRVPTGFCEDTLRLLITVLDDRGSQC
jgi:hypothetical protein